MELKSDIMKWMDLKDKEPYPGQYCFVKKGDSQVFGIWINAEKRFIFISDTSEEDLWAVVHIKCRAENVPTTGGELNFIATAFYDENGNECTSLIPVLQLN
jgi:hypothetical protein